MTPLKVKNYIALLRFKEWPISVLITLLGFILSGGYLQSPTSIALFLALLFFYLGFGFSINWCTDIKEDLISPIKKNLVATGEIKLKNAILFSLILAAAGIAASAYFGTIALLFYLLMTLMAHYYSSPPIRLKSKVIFDLISHGLFLGSMLYLLPFFLFGSEIKTIDWLIALSITHFSMIVELGNHLKDYKWDKKAGIKTTVVYISLKNALLLEKALVWSLPITLLLASFYLNTPLMLLLVFAYYFLLIKNVKYAVGLYLTAAYLLIIFEYLI